MGAKGALIVGLVAVGQEPNIAEAAGKLIQIRDEFQPDTVQHASYDEIFEQFIAVRNSTLPIWKRMAEFSDRAAH